MIDVSTLELVVSGWQDPADGEAEKSRELILGLLRGTPAPFQREQFTPGHVTGTACVLDPAGEAVLLVYHGKLERWLLPGGHVEPELDGTVAQTARREAEEETGVQIDESIPPRLVGLDVHGIPARKREPFHLHHDLMFRFQAASRQFAGSDEVRDLVWCPVDRFAQYDLPMPIRRAVWRSIGG